MGIKDLVIKQGKKLGVVALEAIGKSILDLVKDIRDKDNIPCVDKSDKTLS